MEKILLDTNMFIYLEDYAVTEDKVATLTKRLFDSDQYKIVIHPKTKEEILKIYSTGEKQTNLTISVLSFGFKHGIPKDSDLVFDVRFLPNPYYLDRGRPRS